MQDQSSFIELDDFRGEVRGWLEANFPVSLRGHNPSDTPLDKPGSPQDGVMDRWRKALAGKGWTAPTWPVKYGGGGLSRAQAWILHEEMDRIGAFNPADIGRGIAMVGPTILDYGTEAQKQAHIPPIVRGDFCWCVGYSEPGAGSDLASLRMKCEDMGDHWLINGSKIWTSGAQHSDWCGALVRTDPTVKKHDGISFVLINMRQPGVETRPIKLIAGPSRFSETFFTNAVASKDSMLGEINKGWTVGKRLLQHERASQITEKTGTSANNSPSIESLAKRYLGQDATGRIAAPELRARINRHLMDVRAHSLTLARAATDAKGNAGPSNAASVLKNSATAIAQTKAELAIEIMGFQGLGWEGAEFSDVERSAVRNWLNSKSKSILGGTTEIQYNIISKKILGLPDMTRSA